MFRWASSILRTGRRARATVYCSSLRSAPCITHENESKTHLDDAGMLTQKLDVPVTRIPHLLLLYHDGLGERSPLRLPSLFIPKP